MVAAKHAQYKLREHKNARQKMSFYPFPRICVVTVRYYDQCAWLWFSCDCQIRMRGRIFSNCFQ